MHTSIAITSGIYLMSINEAQEQTSKQNSNPVAFPKSLMNSYHTRSNFQMKYF